MEAENNKAPGNGLVCSNRLSMGLMSCLACFIMMVFRVNISVTILSMVNQTALELSFNSSSQDRMSDCLLLITNDSLSEKKVLSRDGEFLWSKKLQGIIISAGIWGFLLAQMPTGILARRLGPKILVIIALVLGSVLNFLMPIGSYVHFGLLITLRILGGMCQSAFQPATYLLISRWAPLFERARLVGLSLTGVKLGGPLTLIFSGLLCKHGFAGGWPSVFYVTGIVGLLFVIPWYFVVYDNPDKHPRISPEEKDFLANEIIVPKDANKSEVPWSSILTSFPVWAIIVGQTSATFGTIMFMYYIPSFLREMFAFDIASNGGISAIPLIGEWLMLIISSMLADKLIANKKLTVTKSRKIFTLIGTLLPSIFLFILANVSCSTSVSLVLFLLIAAVTTSGCIFGGGIMINHVDLAPRYSSVIFAFCNFIAILIASMCPVIVGALTSQMTLVGWSQAFYMLAGIYIFGGAFYCLAGSGELQPWANGQSRSNKLAEENKSLERESLPMETKNDEDKV